MPANHLLTGPPRSGKTTAIERTVDRLDRTVGGVYSPEIRADGQRVGFAIEALDTGERVTMAHVDRERGPAVGRYRVDVAAVERVAVPAIERGLGAGLIVIDEVAPMQLHSDAFLDAVKAALDADTPVLAAVAADDSGVPGRVKARDDATVYRVTSDSRDPLPARLASVLR